LLEFCEQISVIERRATCGHLEEEYHGGILPPC
jgi:hypothetical protein